MRILLFNICQLLVAWYAFRRGGKPERAVASAMLVAALATAAISLARHHVDFSTVVQSLVAVDLLFFSAMCRIAATADRFWPIWIAALQLDALAIHGVRAYDPEIVPIVYAWSSGQIAYPMIALLAIGTWRHRKREQESGPEAGWSYERARTPAG